MTVLFDHFDDIADGPVNGSVEIWRPDLSPNADGPGATTTNRVVIQVVDGEMTSPELDPGPAKVMLRFGTWSPPKNIVIPDENEPVQLTPLFTQYEPQPPSVVSEAWQAANAARQARDQAVAAAEGVQEIGEDVAQVAADKAAAETARNQAVAASDSAATAKSSAETAASTATTKAADASASASGAASDRAAAESAKTDAVAAKTAAETAASTATTKAAEAAQSAADAAESAADAAAGGVPATRTVTGAGGLTGGGDLSQNRVISIAASGVTNEHVADGALSQSKLSTTGAITDALNARERTANKGTANGYAALDESGKVPAFQLPSYVDDVLEFASTAAFPGIGETGKIYIALDSNKVYRWGGSSYTEISPSPGSTDAVPEGSSNRYFTDARAQAANATAIAAKADDSTVVHTAGAETISGAKTFASSPTVPAPTANGHAARKQDVDAKVGSDGTVITLVRMTQAQYDALGSGRPSTTWYGIVG